MEYELFMALNDLYTKFAGRYLQVQLDGLQLTRQQSDMVYGAYRATQEIYDRLTDLLLPDGAGYKETGPLPPMRITLPGWEDDHDDDDLDPSEDDPLGLYCRDLIPEEEDDEDPDDPGPHEIDPFGLYRRDLFQDDQGDHGYLVRDPQKKRERWCDTLEEARKELAEWPAGTEIWRVLDDGMEVVPGEANQ